MKFPIRTAHAIILVAGLASTPSFAAGELTAAEIRKFIPGKYLVKADFISANIVISAGGKVTGITAKGDKDSGKWSFAGNKICVQFKYWLDGNQKCSGISSDGKVLRGSGFHIDLK